MIIAVDAMGGDFAPSPIVAGAAQAVAECGSKVVLIGDQDIVQAELKRQGFDKLSIPVKHCTEVVGMDEAASVALRKKKDSSIRVAFDLVKHGEAMAVVSAGHSGATMAHAVLALRPLGGVERPAIGTVLPATHGGVLLLDAGANVDCKVHHLVQFAIMGGAYAKYVLGRDNPRVAVLSNGEEEGKGTELTRGAYELLQRSSLNFAGYVEANEVMTGAADVVVTDGFTGNVLLKGIEGAAKWVSKGLETEIRASWISKLGYLLAKGAFANFKRTTDVETYGGAPLLGVNGAAIICHGKAGPKAIKVAIRLAENYIEQKVNLHILQALEASKDLESLATKPAAKNLWEQLKVRMTPKGGHEPGPGA